MTIKSAVLLLTLGILVVLPAFAQQIDNPVDGTQAISYFPQLAIGGGSAQQWITTFTVVNPHLSDSVNAVLYLYSNDGSPLAVSLNNQFGSQFSFTLPPQGSTTFMATSSANALVTGWATLTASLPVESVVRFQYSVNGVPQQGVSTLPTSPSPQFRSPATATSGIAIANPYTQNVGENIIALDANGKAQGSYFLTLCAHCHQSFNVSQIFPQLGSNFRGSVVISGSWLVAEVLSGDSGVLSSYPPAGLSIPASQYERIWKVWGLVLNAAMHVPGFGSNAPNLVIVANAPTINSYACISVNQLCTAKDFNSVHIFLNLADLIGDSESELSFAIAHEMGHIIQSHIGLTFNPGNIEWDADQWGAWLTLAVGYDVYGSAGMLGKLYMATGNIGTVAENFDNVQLAIGKDFHGSLNDRLNALWSEIKAICATSSMGPYCSMYKSVYHPGLPASTPLEKKPVTTSSALQSGS